MNDSKNLKYPFVRILGCCFEQEPDWPEVWGGNVAKGPRHQGLLHSLTKQEFLGRSNLMHEPRGTRKAHSKHGSHGIQGTDMASISVYLCLTPKDCFRLSCWFMIRYEMPCVLLQADWASDPEGAEEYINVMHHAFDINMAMGVLR